MFTTILGITPYETTRKGHHKYLNSHTKVGLPVEKPVGTSARVSKYISSLSQGKNNESEIHSLMKIGKKGKYNYKTSLYFLNFNIKIKPT